MKEIYYSASVRKGTPFPQHKSTEPMRPRNTTDDSSKIFNKIFVNEEIKCHLPLLIDLLHGIPHRNIHIWQLLSGNGSQSLRFCYINLACNKNTVKVLEVSLPFGHRSASLLPYSAIN